MTDAELKNRMIEDYHSQRHKYIKRRKYYEGEHDIVHNYKKYPNRPDNVIVDNFVQRFINEEVQYSLGNPLSYTSMMENEDSTANNEIIRAIYDNTFHWNDNHNQELMKQLEIYGKVYILNYIDKKGRFCEKILNPTEAIEYVDSDGVVQRFIHFYKKKYEDSAYMDIYYPDGRIEIYQDDVIIDTKKQPFENIPISVCKFENECETIFKKIKLLQDSYNNILSDQSNLIQELRNAILVVSGVEVTDGIIERLMKTGTLNFYGDKNGGSVKYLYKDIPDTFIINALNFLRTEIFATVNHIDGNEKLQSNTSGAALRNRLVFLEQRCNTVTGIVINIVYERIERLFEYLSMVGTDYDIKDVKITATPNVPIDDISVIQALTQLGIGTNISLETALSRIPWIENPAQEIAKIKAEQKVKNDPYGDGDFRVGE